MKINKALFTSNKSDWRTPKTLFNDLNAIYKFNIDLAASKDNTLCSRYFDIETNSLEQEWDKDMIGWLNPPYGRDVKRWVAKAYESKAQIVMLIPARTDTTWFHNYIYNKKDVRFIFIKGRLKFGDASNVAPFPSMLVYFRC